MTKILAFDRHRKNMTADTPSSHDLRRSDVPHLSDGANNVIRVLPSSTEMLVSVVVPTRGRPQLLNRCLASLVLQRFDRSRYEIIIVDDGPSEETRDVVSRWSATTADSGPRVTYIPSMGPHGPAAARNHGWRAARAPIVAFTDDDTTPRVDWLKNGVRAFEDGVHAVRGRIVMPLSGTPTDYELDAKNLETAEFVTANCFCRKQVLEDLGGFDERFRFAWREDSDLHFRLLDYQARIVYDPSAVVMHPIRPAAWGVSLQQVKKVQFDALLYKKHPRLYRSKIRARPRWDFYITVSAILACLVALLADMLGAAVASGLVWLVMTGRFCLQRLKQTSKSPAHVAEMIFTSVLIPPLAVFWRAVGAFRFRVGFL